MTTGSSISCCNCTLLIKLLLKLLVLVVHVLAEAAAMMLYLARTGFVNVEYLALVFWFNVPVSRGRVGHVALDTSLALPPDTRCCIVWRSLKAVMCLRLSSTCTVDVSRLRNASKQHAVTPATQLQRQRPASVIARGTPGFRLALYALQPHCCSWSQLSSAGASTTHNDLAKIDEGLHHRLYQHAEKESCCGRSRLCGHHSCTHFVGRSHSACGSDCA